ncbi:g11330 [Coccomyxa viridis]|uniref:G11330 protein n=1 Tax=Coccomyxa viridis TaxID=1274662 RepID=A0ABP1GA86_9CHLO
MSDGMALKIYRGRGSPFAWRVMACAEEKGVLYQAETLDASKKEHKAPEYLAINPRGQLPSLVDGDIVVCESLAALLYLDEAYPEHPLLPSERKERALVFQRSVEISNLQDKALPVLHLKRSNGDPAGVQKAIEALKGELKLWEEHTKHGFAVGSKFTLADTAVGPFVLSLRRYGASLKDYPNLAKYDETIRARPAFQKTVPPQWLESPDLDWLSDV